MAETNGILPPNSVEAEKSVLGALLVSPNAVLDVINVIRPDDFYRKDHKLIYEAMLKLFDEGQTLDVVTVAEKLKLMGVVDKVGGIAYLSSLADEVPLAANAAQYAKIVAEKSTQRKLILAAQEISKQAYNPEGEVSAAVDFAAQSVLDVMQNRSQTPYVEIGKVIPAVMKNIEDARNKSGTTGIPTGFIDLDKMTSGFQNSNLIIVAGRPGAGKTAFMLNIARHVAVKEKLPVAVFNLEMSKEELATRIISTQADLESSKLKTGNLENDDWAKLAEGMNVLADAPLYFDDTTDNTVQAIRSKCRKLKMEKDIKLVIVDYLQLMNTAGRSESRAQEVAEMSRGLKVMAKELGIPVIVGSQLNRESEKRNDKRPQISELRESGSIEQDADIVILLYRPGMNDNQETENTASSVPSNAAEIIVAKHRNGATGTVNMIFEAEKMTFKNISFMKE